MITGELKSKVDRVWEAFWTGGIANPLTVIEQITYLLFIRRLDELHTAKEKKRNGRANPSPSLYSTRNSNTCAGVVLKIPTPRKCTGC